MPVVVESVFLFVIIMALKSPLFDAFSFSHRHVPSIERLLASIRRHEEFGHYIYRTGFQRDRDTISLGSFQPCWLKRIARKVKWEFPGGFPPDHAVYAHLFQIHPGAEEQEMHADGFDAASGEPLFWNIFVPLTFHATQGTTVFPQGVRPSPHCMNYLFDSAVLHHGQANHSTHCRWVLMLVVAHVRSNWQYAVCVDV